jgi:hypothetical protein
VFNRNLFSFCIRKIKNEKPYVFSIGCDFKYVQVGIDRTFMTVFSIKIFPINTTTNTLNDEQFLKNLKTINLVKNKDTGEIMNSNNLIINSEPISEINSFDVDENGEQIIIGSVNGEILLISNFNNENVNDKEQYKISILMKSTKLDITNVKYSKTKKGQKIIYVTTETEILYYLLNKNTNIYEFNFIYNEIGCVKNVFDVDNINNRVIFCSPIDYSLGEINNFDRGACWLIEGFKSKTKIFGENIIFINNNNLLVYDPINKFFIYDCEYFCDKNEKINIIDFFSLPHKKIICIIIERRIINDEENDFYNIKKELIILKEISSNQKLEQFYFLKEFSAAENYVKYKPNLFDDKDLSLAEIIKKRGDYFYTKGEYKNAVNEYKKTIFYIDPSFIIEKFLDTSKLEFLIMFLEEINNNIKYNMTLSEEKRKDYIVLLLYCYLRGKKEVKMNEFIQKAYLNKQYIIIRAAINLCKKII